MSIEQMIEMVRVAMAPGADDATRRRGAEVLRSALRWLELAVAPADVSPASPSAPPPPWREQGGAAAPGDVLGMLIEQIRPHVPAEALQLSTRLHIPLIDFGAGTRKP